MIAIDAGTIPGGFRASRAAPHYHLFVSCVPGFLPTSQIVEIVVGSCMMVNPSSATDLVHVGSCGVNHSLWIRASTTAPWYHL
jgi:hypothetical protein